MLALRVIDDLDVHGVLLVEIRVRGVSLVPENLGSRDLEGVCHSFGEANF